ncbi:MAG: hypothetical protein NTZ86_08905 [Legionellales bacterium]|nr:hypothetical protein [Legionellales bacterium]
MDFPSEKMTHFKRKFYHSPTERNSVKPSKAQKMMDHLVTLLEYASQDIERAQYEPGSHFSKLVEVCGSKKKAKLSFIQDRFDTVIVPWLGRHKVDSALIDQFRSDMSISYTKILNRANVNPSITISTEFASNLRYILAHIDVTQALNPSSPGMNT